MAPYVKEFFSSLHNTYLKPAGYSKERFTFSRDAGAYIERVQFQGSTWNAAGESWRFYINVGLQFKDIPPRSPDRDFPRTHVWERIGNIVDAPSQFDISVESATILASEVNAFIVSASAVISRLAVEVNVKYARGENVRLCAI